MDATAALKEWRQLLGEGRVLDPSAAALAYGVDTGGSERRLAGALKPATADVIPEILRIVQRHGQPVYPFSTGRNWGYGTALPVRQDCVLLDLGDLQAIDFDPELGVVTLEPGG